MTTHDDQLQVTVRVRGQVQGVGFRWWCRTLFRELDLTGTATNLTDGTVEVAAMGGRPGVERLVQEIQGPHAPGRVAHTDVQVRPVSDDDPAGTGDGR